MNANKPANNANRPANNANRPANNSAVNSLNAIANRTLATLNGTRKNNANASTNMNANVGANANVNIGANANRGANVNHTANMNRVANVPATAANHKNAGKYDIPARGIKKWYNSEMGAVGHLASMRDEHLQRMYASKVVNGMKHLTHAIDEKINDDGYQMHHRDFELMKQGVVTAMEHLKKDYNVTEDNISYKWNTMMGGKRHSRKRKHSRKRHTRKH